MTVAPADALVVGGGPAGLATATALRRLGHAHVVVVEREERAGGVPLITDHTGFGARDRHRLLRGPAYADALVADADHAGVEILVRTTAVDWLDGGGLVLHHEGGLAERRARAVVLATGTRERPRAARLIPGDRPAGVHTTAAVQRLVLAGVRIGQRAVVIGAEHVSFSAIDTLAHAGCATVALVTGQARHQSYAPFAWASAGRRRVPVLCAVEVAEIVGRGRVEGVRLSDGRWLACDTVVVSGDWVPEHTLARQGGVECDPMSGTPVVDGHGRTSRPGVFAAGNVLHGALQADWCANEGVRVAGEVAAFLADPPMAWRWAESTPVVALAPLRWVTPGRIDARVGPDRGRLVLAADAFGRRVRVVATQAGRTLGAARPRTPVAPGRPFTVAAPWTGAIRRQDGPVELTLETP